MSSAADQGQPIAEAGIDPAFLRKLFLWFLALAALSLAISVGGKMFGRSVALGGHVESTTLRRIVIGDNVLSAPENAIRFPDARRDGVAQRLDLYLLWPQMTGYSSAHRDAFNNADGSDRVLFLTFEHQVMSRGMSERFELIYRSLIEDEPFAREGNVAVYRFKASSGYVNEVLAVARDGAGRRFVARCLDGELAVTSLAPCSRDLVVGDGLSLSYRFSRRLLARWQELDSAVAATAQRYLARG